MLGGSTHFLHTSQHTEAELSRISWEAARLPRWNSYTASAAAPGAAGITADYGEFNQWCIRQRSGLPVGDVLSEWREANGETRHQMTLLGREAPLTTAAGPYPIGLRAFHSSLEYATHADDVGAPVAPSEQPGRTAWRLSYARFALTEQDAPVKTWINDCDLVVQLGA